MPRHFVSYQKAAAGDLPRCATITSFRSRLGMLIMQTVILIFAVVLGIFALLLVSGTVYQSLSTARDSRCFPAPDASCESTTG